jgi:hypothetical protein
MPQSPVLFIDDFKFNRMVRGGMFIHWFVVCYTPRQVYIKKLDPICNIREFCTTFF